MTNVFFVVAMIIVGIGGMLMMLSLNDLERQGSLRAWERTNKWTILSIVIVGVIVMAIGVFLITGPIGAKIWSLDLRNSFNKLDGKNDKVIVTNGYVEFDYADCAGNIKSKKCLIMPNKRIVRENVNVKIPTFVREGNQYILLWPAHCSKRYDTYEIKSL